MSKTHEQVEEVSFDATVGGKDVTITFDRHTTWGRDAHYGADADGNRGIDVIMLDDDFAQNVRVDIGDGTDRLVGSSTLVTKALETEILDLVDLYLASHDPEAVDDGPNEDDRDDEPEAPEDAYSQDEED